MRAIGTAGWIGFRDVVEVDGKTVTDRRDRLVSLFTDPAGDSNEIARIANENARFNVGPIIRNFNVPTTALFFFMADNLPRFCNGPISVARTPSVGRARTHATYSDFRQFATSGRIVLPK